MISNLRDLAVDVFFKILLPFMYIDLGQIAFDEVSRLRSKHFIQAINPYEQ